MNNELPVIYIARHGETAWTITGSAHRPDGSASHSAGRKQRPRISRPAEGTGVCQGVYEPPSSAPGRRAPWLDSGLWPKSTVTSSSGTTASMRGRLDGGDPRGAPRLGTVPRRQSRRRIARSGNGTC